MRNKSFGFTLIELLVVIAIVSLLSSIVLAALQDSKLKAQDAKTVQQIREFQNAVALFYANTGHYPSTGFAANHEVCVGPSDATCWYEGTQVLSRPESTDFALGPDQGVLKFLSNIISTADAATVKDYLAYQFIDIPVVVVNVNGNNLKYGGGIIYTCTAYSNSECISATVTWATNKPVEKGTPRFSNTTGPQVYEQAADDPGAGDGGVYSY